jgi:hypothetical protein
MASHTSATYQHIADILSLETSNQDLEATLSHPNFDWDTIVIAGSEHLVLPAIYCRLQSKQLLHLLPEELHTYLEELTSINRNRNKRLLNQVQSISQLFSQHQIDHVFVKGSALLALGCYEDNAERMVGDIDILVCKSQLKDAFELLKDNGYDKTFGFAYDNKGFRHMDRLLSEDMLAAVELHGDLFEDPYRDLIAVDAILKSKVYKNYIALPNTYYLSLHNILAYQLNDMGFFYKRIHFKHLYDSVILNTQNNTGLISELLDHKFGQAYLELAKCYFKEFSGISSTKRMLSYRKQHQNYITKPFYRKALRPMKQGYQFTKHRLQQVLFNPSYRIHALKKIFLREK